MKKVTTFVIAIAAVLALSVALVGCGSSGNDNKGASAGNAGGDAVKVGCIYIGSANDGCFTQQMDESLENAAKATGVELVKNENTAEDKQTVTDVATNMIDQGCTIIVGCSYGFGEAMDELANSGKYDNVTFLHFSGPYQNEATMENFFGSMDQARYLTGMAAAAVSKTGKLGYVAAFPFTEVQIGINSFTLGAQAINPDIDVQVVYINTWGDAELEKSAAEQLLAADCDVLAYHADSTATQVAAAEAGAYAIGWNLKNNAAGDKYLTAAYWDFTEYFTERFNQIKDGTFKPTGIKPFSTYGTLADSMINVDEFSADVPADVKTKIEDAKAKLISGEMKVFSGAIEYADGTALCADGQSLTDEEIWQINNVIKGVTAIEAK